MTQYHIRTKVAASSCLPEELALRLLTMQSLEPRPKAGVLSFIDYEKPEL
jgi:hypothetical protein